MRTEYLITINNKDNICKDEQSFANLLMINSDIKVHQNTIEYKNKKYSYENKRYTQRNAESDNSDYIYFHLTITADINTTANNSQTQAKIRAYENLLRDIRVAISKVTATMQTIWDDVSFYYSKMAYPLIYDMENSMRKLITKFMVINIGANWVKENTPDNLTEYVNDNKTEGILYKFNFMELRSYLFDEFTMHDCA